MSRLRITVPFYAGVPDDFRFVHENGGRSVGVTLGVLMQNVRLYRKQNNLPIPDDMQQIVEDQLCRVLPPGNCKFEDGGDQSVFVSKRITANDVAAGMKVLASVVVNQRTVERPVAEERAAICAACPANDNVDGCFGCASLEGTISAIVGAKKTKVDHLLKVCLACHCFSRANVWVDQRDLAAGVSDQQLEKLKLFAHCWKWKAVEEQRALDKKEENP